MTTQDAWLAEVARANPLELTTRLYNILDATTNEVYVADAKTWQILHANAAACDHLGYTLDEVRELTPERFVVDFSRGDAGDRVRRLFEAGREEVVKEVLHRRKDGSTYPVETRLVLSRFEDDDVILGVAQDITARTKVETDLRESRRRYELALQAADVSVWDADLTSLTTVFDPRLEEIMERSFPGPVSDAEWNSLVHPDDRPLVHERWVAHLKGQLPVHECEFRVQTRSGGWRWLRSRGRVVERDGSGRVTRAAGTYIDITDERVAAQALAEAQADAIATFNASGDGCFLLDSSFCVLRANSDARIGIRRFYGKEIAEGASLFDLIAGTDGEFVREHATKALEEQRRILTEYELTDGDARFWHEFAFAPVVLDSGSVRGVAMLVRNIDQRKRAEAALLQSEKIESLGLLAGGIAHDFNNLLVAVLGNVGLALEELGPHSPARVTLLDAEQAAVRAADLASQLLAYSGRTARKMEHLNISDVVAEIGQLLKIAMGANIRFTTDFTNILPAVEGDATQLRQVLMNLVVNARDAIGTAEGEIHVSTGVIRKQASWESAGYLGDELPDGNYVFMDISDSGAGMSPETVRRIFDPFFTTKPNGRGLGLAAVLGIIRAHRGTLRVTTELGRGTTFRMVLPASTGLVGRKLETKAEPTWRGDGVVLLVDDDPSVRTVTSRALTSLGFATIEAPDGRTAVELAAEAGEELVCAIVDLTMPGMDGNVTSRALRELRPELPIVLLSGFAADDLVAQLDTSVVQAFIQKPYRLPELRDTVREVIEGARWGL